jgi:DNA-binding SARP family transcriptional activator
VAVRCAEGAGHVEEDAPRSLEPALALAFEMGQAAALARSAAKGVEIRLLGDLQVARDGSALPLPASKKTRALLAYLAATAASHSREKLCDLLWPGPEDPRAALRWSLTKIRALLDDRTTTRIVADRERVQLDVEDIRIDLAEVRAKLASAPFELATETLREVAARFRGELLEGLDLADAYRFHEWLAAERESARALRLRVLGALIDRLANNPEVALLFARERVAVDPLAESAHVAVVRLLAQLGNRRGALEQFDTCTRILATELHATASPALLAARMMIQPTSSPPAPSAIASLDPSSPIQTVTSLLGRARECAAIDSALASRSPILLFSGDPGIGKSRLLDELAVRGTAKGARVLRGRAYEAERIRPYGAWIDALRSRALGPLDDVLCADLAPLLPELGAPATAGERARLFDAVARLLAGLAPLVVIVDDVQWLDEASAALFHATARANLPGVVLACGAREGELQDNPPALRLLRALAKDGRLGRFDLTPLDEQATIALVRTVDPRVDVDRVRRESAGNPLFAIEIARALSAGGDEIPASLDGIIADRLAGLDEAAREIVPWAAAFGRTFDLDALARVTGLAAATLASGLEELERRGIVRAFPEGAHYDFVHDLIRDGAYRRLSSPRRRLAHGQIARALAAGGYGDGSIAGDVARHASLGGERELAGGAYLAAAERALRVFAHLDAMRFAEAGIDSAARLPPDVRIPLHLALLRVKVMSAGLHGERRALATELARTVSEAQDAGLHADASAGLHTLSILQNDAGDSEGAHASTLRAARVAEHADARAKARQLSDSARCLAMLEREMPRAHEMLRMAEAILGADAEATLHFTWGQGLMHRFSGHVDEGRALIERTVRLARAAEDHWAVCEALIELAQLELEVGDAPRAIALCAELAPVAARMGEGSEGPIADALEALARSAAGEDVGAQLDRAIDRLRAVDAKGMLAYVLNSAAALDLARGGRETARARAKEALQAAEIVGRSTQTVIARAVLGRLALADGDGATAMQQLDAVREDVGAPLRVSARARTAALDLALRLGTPIEKSGDPP